MWLLSVIEGDGGSGGAAYAASAAAATPGFTPISIAAAIVTCSPSTAVYTGSPITPAVIVKLVGKTLVAIKDYTVAYSANKVIGKATIKITGSGSYTGTKTATFKIIPKKVALKSAKAGKRSVKLAWAKAAAA